LKYFWDVVYKQSGEHCSGIFVTLCSWNSLNFRGRRNTPPPFATVRNKCSLPLRRVHEIKRM
jgi:hypothetical protein